jgi:hypothetical protein
MARHVARKISRILLFCFCLFSSACSRSVCFVLRTYSSVLPEWSYLLRTVTTFVPWSWTTKFILQLYKIKSCLCVELIKHHTTNKCVWGTTVTWRWFISLTLPPLYPCEEIAPVDWYARNWVGPSAELIAVEKRAFFCICRVSNPGSSVVHPVVSHYTNWQFLKNAS